MQLKLSELVLAMKGAENKFVAIEDLTDEELQELHEDSKKRAEIACQHLEDRRNANSSSGHIKQAAAHPTKRDASKTGKSAHKSAKS